MEWVHSAIGMSAAVVTTASFVPQLIKAYRTKSVRDFSWIMLIVLSIGLSLWLTYGIFIKDAPIIIANGVTLSLVMVLQILKIRYNRHDEYVRNVSENRE